MPFNQLRSKLDRAIVAYLKTCSIYCAVPNVTANIYKANWSGDVDASKGPLADVRSHDGVPALTSSQCGVWKFWVQVGIEGPAANQPGQANKGQQSVALDNLTGQMIDALSISTDGTDYQAAADAITAAGRALAGIAVPGSNPPVYNDADMLAFTCQYWYAGNLTGGNPRDQGGAADTTLWKELASFTAICCASNVS
jgi:hypothetical protein